MTAEVVSRLEESFAREAAGVSDPAAEDEFAKLMIELDSIHARLGRMQKQQEKKGE
tara:strand:- start:75 stop:242 length:168 start_codon:yes stop_codon:yes gene_type:complete